MKWKDAMMMALAIIIVLGVLGTVIVLMKYQVPTENKDALYLVLGTLVGSFTTVVSYFFGSSKGSADKAQTIGEIAVTGKPIV